MPNELSKALGALCSTLDADVGQDLPAEHGSILKRWRLLMSGVSRREVDKILRDAYLAAQLKTKHEPAATITRDLAEAVGLVSASLENRERAALRVGVLLFVKNGPDLVVETLSPEQLEQLSRNPSLLKDPEHLLDALRISEESL